MEPEVQVDVVSQNGAQGSMAARLLANNFNVQALRTLSTLRKDEWVHYDTAITEVARERLVGVADLMNAGLTYSLPNALGHTSLEWEKVSDMEGAQTSMSGVTEGQNDRIDFGIDSMPVPIVHKDFHLNIRALAASRNNGMALDTAQAERAARKVSETLESMLFLGSTVLGSNKPIYGYTSQPNRTTGSVTASWSLVTTTGAQMLADLLKMVDAATTNHMYGPYMLYVPKAAYTNMGNDYKAESDKTILQRLKEVPGIKDIRPTEQLTGSNIVLVQMTRDVVEIIDGIQPTVVQWETNGGFVQHFKVLAIMPPRMKNDYEDQSGIVHYA